MAGGTATIAASAATLSDRGTGPQSSANPSGVRRIERTVTPVRTVKRPDAASAIGSRPTPPVIAANAEPAAESLAPSPVAARAAATSEPPSRSCAASAGSAARSEIRSARPAYTPASSGSTSRSTTSSPSRSRTNSPTPMSPANGGNPGRVGSTSIADSDAALSRPDARAAATSNGTPISVPAGSGCNRPAAKMDADVVTASTSSSPSPAARARSSASGRRVSTASAPTSTGWPATEATRSLPPTCGVASSTVTAAAELRSQTAQAAARPAMPAPTTTTCTSVRQLLDERDHSGENVGIGLR